MTMLKAMMRRKTDIFICTLAVLLMLPLCNVMAQSKEIRKKIESIKGTEEERVTVGQTALTMVESGATPKYTADIWFRVKADADGLCRFWYSLDGKSFKPAGDTFQAREGRWIGAKVGFFCSSFGTGKDRGWIDIDWFRIE